MSVNYEMARFLEGVVGVVEATSCEQQYLWQDNRVDKFVGPAIKPWKENLAGCLQCVGHFAKAPIYISLRTAEIDGHKILFWNATSQVVDYRVIEAWMEANIPQSARRSDGYINQSDATNFRNVFHRMPAKPEPAQ